MRNPMIAAAILSLFALAGCADQEQVPSDEPAMEATTEAEDVPAPAFSTETRTEFRPFAGADSLIRGTLRLLVPVAEYEDEPMHLRVELTGLSEGEHAWHVYGAPCDVADAPLAVPISPPQAEDDGAHTLTAGPDGEAEAEIPVPPLGELWVEAGAYSVRVHRSAGADPGPVVACAIL